MNIKQIVNKNKILEIVTGSHLYGTETESSDKDFAGIFIASPDYYIGLKNVEEVSDNIVSKDDNGKNKSDAVDKKFYELRQFFKLTLNNNPNILEFLFVNDKNIIYKNRFFDIIKENKQYFLDSKIIKDNFIGYAISQEKKMIIKLENYDILSEAYRILENSKYDFLVEENNFKRFEFRNNINTEFRVADIFIPRNISIKRAKEILQARLGRVGNRQELILKYGFDVKFASHCIRLLLEAKELLETQNLNFPLKYADRILDIKKGKYKVEEILEQSTILKNEIENNNFQITFKRDYNKVEEILMYIMKSFLKNNL